MSWSEWADAVEIEPSIYASDFSRLGDQLGVLQAAGARVFHFDVGDGHFIPEVTIGPSSPRPSRRSCAAGERASTVT